GEVDRARCIVEAYSWLMGRYGFNCWTPDGGRNEPECKAKMDGPRTTNGPGHEKLDFGEKKRRDCVGERALRRNSQPWNRRRLGGPAVRKTRERANNVANRPSERHIAKIQCSPTRRGEPHHPQGKASSDSASKKEGPN